MSIELVDVERARLFGEFGIPVLDRRITVPIDATNQHVAVGINGFDDGKGDVTTHVLGICRQAREQNYYDWFQAGDGQRHSAPPLIACVLDANAVDTKEGAIGMFPGNEQTCAHLGLAVAKI